MADAAKMGRQRARYPNTTRNTSAARVLRFQDASAADVIRVFEAGLRGGSDGVSARVKAWLKQIESTSSGGKRQTALNNPVPEPQLPESVP
jgi:hypothetical protein